MGGGAITQRKEGKIYRAPTNELRRQTEDPGSNYEPGAPSALGLSCDRVKSAAFDRESSRRLRFCFGVGDGGYGAGSFCRRWILLAGEIKHERCDFKGHFF